MPASAVRSRVQPLLLIVAAMALGAGYAALMGEDANWDWQNYHEYNVWALLHGGYDRDALPPGFQTYFNPLVYVPWYGLRHMLPPLAAGMVMGAVHGLNLALVGWLTQILLGRAATMLTVGAAVLLAACGPMTLSEVGTSFADITTALPIIAGLALMLGSEDPRPLRYMAAGLLVGLAVGFKLTNIVFALGLGVAALAAARPLLAMSCLALGGAVGCAATGGAWSLMLWREFGNPIFPMFNAVFRSPELMAANIMDWQFLPHGLLDALAYPFYWLVGDNRSSEYPFRDARFAVATVLIVLGIGRGLVTRTDIFARRDTQFLLFFGVSYAAWLAVFAIQRYAVALELLCAPLIVLLIARIMAGVPGSIPRRVASPRLNAAMLVAAVAIALWSQPGDWFRRPWSSPYQPAISNSLEQPANYLLLDKPLAYIAPLLPPQSRFYLIADIALPVMPDGKFDRRIRTALQDPPAGGNWGLHTRDKPIREPLLERYGLRVDASRPCVEIEGAWLATAVEACPLVARAK